MQRILQLQTLLRRHIPEPSTKYLKNPSTIYEEINTEAWKRELTMPELYKSLEENRKRC